ncbi:MAG: O-phosphoseryl-tRNA(Sec) selenium transferase [Candidatus Thorarchaeota archaeon]
MDAIEERLLGLIPKNMAERGIITLDSVLGPIRDILNRRQFPLKPLTELQVEWMLQLLASLDTDKDPKAIRVGEREARVATPLVARLAAGFNHGIGRSGHVTAPQPKAAGASLMQQVCNAMATDAIRRLGTPNVKRGVVLPLSTGMSVALTFGALRRELKVRRVLYPRIDHTSPLRGLALAGMDVTTIPTTLVDDAVVTDMDTLEKEIAGAEDTAVLATTTFFPPRESDSIKEIARLCADHHVPLVINNAYGVQSEKIMKSIRSAIDAGRVDFIIQSTDKNFLTPVGGSIVVTPRSDAIEWVAETYAGRATAAPVVQLLAALTSIGLERYKQLREEQSTNRRLLDTRLRELAEGINQRVLETKNEVSCAMTLDGLDAHKIGAMLYNRRVTGPRAVAKGENGSCIDEYPHSYIVMNAAIGSRQKDVKEAVTKLFKVVSEV